MIFQHPAIVLMPQHRVVPGDARIVDHDVGLRVASDPVTRRAVEEPVGALKPDTYLGTANCAAWSLKGHLLTVKRLIRKSG